MNFPIVVHFEPVDGTLFSHNGPDVSAERIGPPAFTAEEVELIHRGMDLSDFADRL